ncbi:MAG: hypothetical protein DMF59_14025 [Acidobacteria bacterium]|nr:MAG: hypothetical protein DMF59_14025 [Acidobacteriota bacterium]
MEMSYIGEIAMRLGAATLVAAGVGLDRELRHKPAGLKTHALVGLGSALIVVVAAAMVNMKTPDVEALSRVIQGLIAGVGFLGGGAILKSSSDEMVTGLTTAASIWLVASLGVACGAGQWAVALIGFGIALVVLVGGNAAEKFVIRSQGQND